MNKVMKRVRKALEGQYKGLCTIWEYENTEDEDTGEEISKPELIPVHEDIPCKLSKRNMPSTSDSGVTNTIRYEPVLFINPDVEIKAGSIITVAQNGVTREYKRSGEPFNYTNHQEIVLQRTETI